MQGINPDNIPLLIERDVKRVREEAVAVIDLNDGTALTQNNRGRLSVLAVIGPGDFLGERYNEAVLCEVGIGRGRPYREAFVKQTRQHIAKRRKWFSLSEYQYQEVALFIFQILADLTARKIEAWKVGKPGNPFYLPTPNNFFLKRKKKVKSTVSMKGWINGVRYTVSKADRFISSDIFATELHNPEVVKRMKGLASFLTRTLSEYKKVSNLEQLSGLKYGQEAIHALDRSKLPKYLKFRMFREFIDFSPASGPYWYPFLLQHLCQEAGPVYSPSKLEEEKLVLAALPEVKSRTNGLRVHLVRQKNGYVVFEVKPSTGLEAHQPAD